MKLGHLCRVEKDSKASRLSGTTGKLPANSISVKKMPGLK